MTDPILDYAFGAFALVQFLTFVRIGTRGLKALADLRVALSQQTAATAAVEKSVEELRDDQRSHPCRMTVTELRDLLARLQPGSSAGSCSACQSPGT